MTGERTKTRFGREKSVRGYVPAEGAWESVLVGIREELPEQIHGVGEGDHFLTQDEKATMNLKQAVFQYYLAGTGHMTLATMVIDSFPQMRAGDASPEMKRKIISDLANSLYDEYPEKYKALVKR